MREILMTTARDVTTGTNHPEFSHEAVPGPDTATGDGLVDAHAAVLLARSEAPAVAAPAPEETAPAGSRKSGQGASGEHVATAVPKAGTPSATGDAPLVVAMAVLRPTTRSHDPAPATAALRGQVPPAETITDVAAALIRAGFSVGPPNGPTFSIAASAAVFGEHFGTEPVRADDGGWTTPAGDELPLDVVPEEVRGALSAVVLERPAELHRPDR